MSYQQAKMTSRFALVFASVVLFGAIDATADSTDAPAISFHGAISTYYSYSINQPPENQRVFNTQPARSGTIAIDLAVLGAQWSTDRVTIRTAFQAGTWADANYVDADRGWRYIREVSAVFNIDSTWFLAAGLFPSHIGHESSINSENMLLSRSLTAEWTPYFVTGAGVIYQPSSDVSIVAYVLNGWQKVVDNNDELSFGTKLEWQVSSNSTLSWNTYFGNDENRGDPARYRVHNNFWYDHQFSDAVRLVLLGDVSLLRRAPGGEFDLAAYGAVKSAWRITDLLRVGGRIEYLNDPNNAMVLIDTPFDTFGASLGLDVIPYDHIMLRFEARGYQSTEALYPAHNGMRKNDLFFTVALAGSF